MSPAPAGVSFATPADWIVLDLEAFEDRRAIAAAVDARAQDEPELAAYRDELVDQVASACVSARRVGVEFAAMLATIRDEMPVIASVTLAHLRGGGDAAELASAHAERVQAAPDVVSVPTPLPVHLPAGTAGRTEHVRQHPLPGGASLTTLSVQYLIPVPGTDDMTVLSFSSPTLAARPDLVQRFHAIAESVSFE